MDPYCKEITDIVLPAIRASIAITLEEKHNFTQQMIGAKLGIAQAAVSKYIKGNCSKPVLNMRDYIISRGLVDKVVDAIVSGSNNKKIEAMIDRLCSDKSLLNAARVQS